MATSTFEYDHWHLQASLIQFYGISSADQRGTFRTQSNI